MGGHPNAAEGYHPRCALLSVTTEVLVLAIEKDAPIVFTPDEVVGFRIDRGGWIWSAVVLIVDHVAFDRIGNVSLTPEDGTCEQLLAEIKRTGFCPKAQPGVPWEPGQPFPLEEI